MDYGCRRLLQIIIAQGMGDSLLLKIPDAAAILGCDPDELTKEATSGKIQVKKFSHDVHLWRITAKGLLDHSKTAKIFTDDDDY